MKVRLTILCDNSVGVPFGVIGEHGFACFLETEHGNYLFDTGQGYTIVHNSLALKTDLRSIEAILISHGHYDHTGGLPDVLKIRGRVEVHGHPDIFTERIWSSEGQTRFIGLPFSRRYLEFLGATFRLDDGMVEVGKGVYLTGEIPRTNVFEKGDAKMAAVIPGGETVRPDPLKDDLSLVVESSSGLVLVLGCAHAGMINIIEFVMKQMKRDHIHTIVGGTHLAFASEDQLNATIDVIERYNIERIGVSHCTGQAQASRLHARLKDRFFFGNVGFSVDL